MWPFKKKPRASTIRAEVREENGEVVVDVSGQTCPGYLLSINRAVEPLSGGTKVTIATTYAPCGDDVHAWCKEKGYRFRELVPQDDAWLIRITT